MALTPNSSSTPYITVDEFLARKDVRVVGELVRDDNGQSTQTQLETDPNLADALAYASGMLEAACLAGERYGVADLQAANGVSQQFMKGILADIAFYRLLSRRDAPEPPALAVKNYEDALEILKRLKNGDAIFAFQETEEAGVPEDQFMTTADIQNLNLLSYRCGRALGNRMNVKRPY